MGVKTTVNQGGAVSAEQQGAIAGQPTPFENMDVQSGQMLEERHTHLEEEGTPFSPTVIDAHRYGVNP